MTKRFTHWRSLVAMSACAVGLSASTGCTATLDGGATHAHETDAGTNPLIDGGTRVDGGGGVDGGGVDGGGVDGGVSIDAGGIDAGSMDAGSMDAGAPPIDGGSVVIPTDASFDFSLSPIQNNQSTRESVLAFATAQSSTPSITLHWSPVEGRTVSAIQIFRKTRAATAWGSAYATPAASADRFIDTGVSLGDYFEYKIQMTTSAGTAYGNVAAGIETPARDYNGKLVLLVDSTIESALTSELTELVADLEGEGWNVIRSSVSQSASVSSVRETIRTAYNADPANVRAVFLFGHIPVPYSGNVNPDGHGDHRGAWPADGYYGEMNSTWSDTSVTSGNNSPGDGKFDPSTFPSAVELEVGRVDMHNMDGFSASVIADDPILYMNYMSRAHRYRARELEPTVRGLIIDNFDNDPYVTRNYRFAGSGWRNMVALMGPWDVNQPLASVYDTATYVPYYMMVNGQSYLWTYAAGGGSNISSAGIGETWDFAATHTGGFFNMCLGSYFGDWNQNNNFMRAFIAGGNGLTVVWAGVNHWFFQHMGMGETIGVGTRITMNNEISGLYVPKVGSGGNSDNVYLGLMGDPTLRIGTPAPASNFVVSNAGGKFRFAWTASPEAVNGYHIYEITSGAITRVTGSPVSGTSFTSTIDYAAGRRFSVRALRLQTNWSGSHYDLSLGRVATAP